MQCPKCHQENPPESTYCGKCATRIRGNSPQDPPRPDVTETMAAAVEELATGSTFAGRYQVIEELGAGGMGRVYKVRDTKVGEKIALKLIRPEAGLDKRSLERFSNELKLARKIRHKNVCQMFDLGEDRGTRFITMEYVYGEDLRQLIRKVGRLSPGQAVAIARQVCDGLEEAHRLGVVHRDLKPQNIMLDEDGNARIMDFGIARSLTGKSITGAGAFIGTPEYMSPEQVEGKDIDERSDIYSLGVILYETVAGRRPFDGETALSIAHKHKYEAPEDPRKIDPQIPEGLARTILKCLEKDKTARYESARALDADLAGVEEGLPTTEKAAARRKGLTTRDITVKFNVRKILLPAILVSAAIVAAVFFFLIRKPGPALDPKFALVSIFVNRTGDAALDPLGRVAAYEIAQGLSQAGIMKVVPTLSVLETSRVIAAGSGVPEGQDELRALAKGTGAGTLVSGAYYLIDGELQFHAAITDVARRKPMLIQSLEAIKGSLDDKMGLVTELRGRVIGILALHFTYASIRDYVTKIRRPPIYEAYQEYLRGLDLFGVDYEQSVRHFARAVDLDPTFAQAKLYMAVAYGNQGQYEKADALLRSILEVRDELSAVENRLLDWYEATLKGQNEKVLRFAREAEKLSPNHYTLKYIVGHAAIRINRPREAVDVFAWMDSQDRKIYFTRPSTAWWFSVLADAHHMLGEYRKEMKVARLGRKHFPEDLDFPADEARALAALGKISEVGRVVEGCRSVNASSGTPGDVMMEAARELYAHGHRDASRELDAEAVEWAESRPEAERRTEARQRFYAYALYHAGRWDEAGRIFESLAAGHPEDINYQGSLGTLAARRGDREGAMRVFGELAKLERPFLFGRHLYWQACIASLLGEKERAVALLEEAFSQGLDYGVHLHRNIDLEPLWDYPPFIELLRPKG
jgi:tetratricopeptide (TPR) repeat protein/predicted Ser/Thr protein kinase